MKTLPAAEAAKTNQGEKRDEQATDVAGRDLARIAARAGKRAPHGPRRGLQGAGSHVVVSAFL